MYHWLYIAPVCALLIFNCMFWKSLHSSSRSLILIILDQYTNHLYLISSPFSCKLLSLGSGGTFPTQGFMRDPATEIVHEPQSPLWSMQKIKKVSEGKYKIRHYVWSQHYWLCDDYRLTRHSLLTTVFGFHSQVSTRFRQWWSRLEVLLFSFVTKNSHSEVGSKPHSRWIGYSECAGGSDCYEEEKSSDCW
jgi:hypothetical protein